MTVENSRCPVSTGAGRHRGRRAGGPKAASPLICVAVSLLAGAALMGCSGASPKAGPGSSPRKPASSQPTAPPAPVSLCDGRPVTFTPVASTSSTSTSAPTQSSGPSNSQTDGPADSRSGSLDGLVPAPTTVTPGDGSFELTAGVVFGVQLQAVANARGPACLLAELTARALGRAPVVVAAADVPTGRPHLDFAGPQTGVDLGQEGYQLDATSTSLTIRSSHSAGFGWAIQTVRQLAGPELWSPKAAEGSFSIPAVAITDQPWYRWRGVMLDVARHFFGVADIEHVVDMAAAYKLNVLHLHLTDDQGWRIEIKGYPQLTARGGASEVGGGTGGYMTQDQYRSLVEYAARRGVIVVPEIDMPGHTNAALSSVPELNCDGKATKPYTGTQVGFSSLCIGGPATDRFVEAVISQIADLTPGPYLHIGGDESNSTAPADYVKFVRDAAARTIAHGKIPVGWAEISSANLGPDAVAQHWRDAADTQRAAADGLDVVMSPASRAYLDMRYGDFAPAGNSWAGSIDVRRVYDWDPATEVPGVPAPLVAGVEAPLWSELVSSRDDIDHRLLPRLPAIAEVAWSSPDHHDWTSFAARVATQAPRWDQAGWAYTPDPAIAWP